MRTLISHQHRVESASDGGILAAVLSDLQGERQLHPRVLTLWRLGSLISWLILGLVVVGPLAAMAVADWISWWPAIVAGISVLGLACFGVWYAGLRYRAWQYTFTGDALEMRSGVVFRSISAVPYHRIQQIDVEQGPIQRRLGLVGLRLRTASSGTDGRLPGIATEEAEVLRAELLAKAGQDDGA